MRIIFSLFLAAFFVAAPSRVRADITHFPIRALLVIASKNPGESDARLAPYEANLRRILRFESFHLVGEDSAELAKTRGAILHLNRGHTLEVGLESIAGRYSVDWKANGQSLMATRLALRPNVPAVLGGPSTGKESEVWAVIIIAAE